MLKKYLLLMLLASFATTSAAAPEDERWKYFDFSLGYIPTDINNIEFNFRNDVNNTLNSYDSKNSYGVQFQNLYYVAPNFMFGVQFTIFQPQTFEYPSGSSHYWSNYYDIWPVNSGLLLKTSLANNRIVEPYLQLGVDFWQVMDENYETYFDIAVTGGIGVHIHLAEKVMLGVKGIYSAGGHIKSNQVVVDINVRLHQMPVYVSW